MNSGDDFARFIAFIFFLLAMICIIGAVLSKITAHLADKVWKQEDKDDSTET